MRQFEKEDFVPKSQRKVSLFTNARSLTFFESMLEIYSATCDINNFTEVHIPPELLEWATMLYTHHNQSIDLIKPDRSLKKQIFPVDTDSIIHLVTAGKDSTASIIKNRDSVTKHHLLHVGGVNKIYPTEHRMASHLYKTYFPVDDYHFVKVQLPRVTGASESPIKNMFIMVLAIEYFQKIPKSITLGGSQTIADISETEVYGDTSKGLVPFLATLNACYGSTLAITPYLRDQVEAYTLCASRNIPYYDMASCMSQMRFKGMQRKMGVAKYTRVVDGHTLLAATTTDGKSLFDLPEDTLTQLKLSDLTNIDEVKPESDYRCIQGCFKCREKALVYANHLGFNYHPAYIKSCQSGIINWMDKSPNKNRINLTQYFTYVLGIALESIQTKYHSYLSGQSERPDGWKQPKPPVKKPKVAK